jgi:hypothetical protein
LQSFAADQAGFFASYFRIVRHRPKGSKGDRSAITLVSVALTKAVGDNPPRARTAFNQAQVCA